MPVSVAAACYAINCALGLAVARRWVDTSDVRWVHHALFVATATSTALAVATGRGGRWLTPALVPLAIIPFAGRRRHVATALSAAPLFALALWKARN